MSQTMKFTYKGKQYDFDAESLSVAEAREIKAHAGMTIVQWQEGLELMDVDALVGLLYLAIRRDGGEVEWSDFDDLNLLEFGNHLVTDNNLDPEALANGEVRRLPTPANREARRGNTTAPRSKRAAARR